MRLSRRLALGASVLALAVCSACSTGGGSKPTIKIGSGRIRRSAVMAEAYAQVLEANGYTVDRAGIGLGDRKVTAARPRERPDRPQARVHRLRPRRATAARPTGDAAANQTALQEILDAKGGGITVLAFTPGQDQNAFVVRKETADELSLTKMSDVAAVQDQLKLGLATDCPTNPLCGAALKDAYGIDTSGATLLDACSTPMADALKAGPSTSASCCSTQPDIIDQRLGPARGRQADPAGRQHRAARPQRLPRQDRQGGVHEAAQRRVGQDRHRDPRRPVQAGERRQEGHQGRRLDVPEGAGPRQVAGPARHATPADPGTAGASPRVASRPAAALRGRSRTSPPAPPRPTLTGMTLAAAPPADVRGVVRPVVIESCTTWIGRAPAGSSSGAPPGPRVGDRASSTSLAARSRPTAATTAQATAVVRSWIGDPGCASSGVARLGPPRCVTVVAHVHFVVVLVVAVLVGFGIGFLADPRRSSWGDRPAAG